MPGQAGLFLILKPKAAALPSFRFLLLLTVIWIPRRPLYRIDYASQSNSWIGTVLVLVAAGFISFMATLEANQPSINSPFRMEQLFANCCWLPRQGFHSTHHYKEALLVCYRFLLVWGNVSLQSRQTAAQFKVAAPITGPELHRPGPPLQHRRGGLGRWHEPRLGPEEDVPSTEKEKRFVVNKETHTHTRVYIYIYIYICSPPPEDLPGGLYVARSVSPSKHLAFGSNPSVCSIISHATVVFALLRSRTIPTKYL